MDQCLLEPFTPQALLVDRIPFLPFWDWATYVAAPLVLLLAIANLLTAVPLADVINLIRGMITEPGLFLFSRRRAGYGTVYESLSKRPIDLALIRVIDDATGRVVLTRVSDRMGRFVAFVPEGRYRFAVVKRGYVFPTALLAGETYDPDFGPITTGRVVEHNRRGPLEVNLPVDAPEDAPSVRAAIRRHVRRNVQRVLAYAGLVLAALAVVYAWNWQTWVLLGVHLLLFLVFRRLTERPWGRRWGIVSDESTRNPLQRSVVRLVDARFGRVVETQVVDRRGEYGFVVGRSKFRLFSDREGYEPFRGDEFDVPKPQAAVYRDVSLRPNGRSGGQVGYNPQTS